MIKRLAKRPRPPRRRPVHDVPAQAATTTTISPYPANKRFVFKEEVLERIGVSYVCLWRWMSAGKFPTARAVGSQSAWLASEIDEWIESRPKRKYGSKHRAEA